MRDPLKPTDELVDKQGVHITNRTAKSKVIAEFVDAIPEPKLTRVTAPAFVKQDGLQAGFEKAMANPGRAMLLLEYGKEAGSKSEQKRMAKWREKMLQEQGYRESLGWTIRAVDNQIYCMYDPRTMEY